MCNKKLNINNYYRNAHQQYKEVSFHTGQNDPHKKYTNKKHWRQNVEKREPCHSIGGNITWFSTMENSMEVP